MKTLRPVLEEQKLDAFLDRPSQAEKLPSEGEGLAQRRKISQQKNTPKTNKPSARKKTVSPTKANQKTIVKFQIELPVELRKRIKFVSVADSISMNELIVAVLQKQFR